MPPSWLQSGAFTLIRVHLTLTTPPKFIQCFIQCFSQSFLSGFWFLPGPCLISGPCPFYHSCLSSRSDPWSAEAAWPASGCWCTPGSTHTLIMVLLSSGLPHNSVCPQPTPLCWLSALKFLSWLLTLFLYDRSDISMRLLLCLALYYIHLYMLSHLILIIIISG